MRDQNPLVRENTREQIGGLIPLRFMREGFPSAGPENHNQRKNMKKTILILLLQCCALLSVPARAGNENGSAGDMPAYYDHQLLTINFMELPSGGENANIARNGSINTIFMSDAGLPGGQPFISVLDAIQGDGFNPLWLEVQINFTAGHNPRQLFSDDEIMDAFRAREITLSVTDELY